MFQEQKTNHSNTNNIDRTLHIYISKLYDISDIFITLINFNLVFYNLHVDYVELGLQILGKIHHHKPM